MSCYFCFALLPIELRNGECDVVSLYVLCCLSMDLFILCVACLTVFVNCLVNQFAICLDRPCMVFQRECVLCM